MCWVSVFSSLSLTPCLCRRYQANSAQKSRSMTDRETQNYPPFVVGVKRETGISLLHLGPMCDRQPFATVWTVREGDRNERETPGAGAERRREKGSKYYDFFHCMMG